MTSLPDVQVNISSTVSHTIRLRPTMPSYTGIRNPQGRLHPPYPRPTGEISEGLPIWDFSVFLIHYKGIKFSEYVQKQKIYVN